MKIIHNRLINYRFSIILALSAFTIWLFSIQQARINLIKEDIGDMGIITILPLTYFIAFIVLTISFFLSLRFENKNEKVLFSHVIVLILFLYLSPILIEGSRLRFAYSALKPSDYIIQHGFIDPSIVIYHNWPGFHILVTFIIKISNISTTLLTNSGPALPGLFVLILLYILYGILFNEDVEKKWIAIWTFFLIQWVNRDFFSSQTIGYLLFFLIFILLFYILINNLDDTKYYLNSSHRALIIILFSGLVITHFLTAIFIFIVILMYYLFKYLKYHQLVFLTALILISWAIYGASTYFNSNISDFIMRAMNLDLIFNENLTERIVGTPGRLLLQWVRIFYAIMVFSFVITGIMISLKTKTNIINDKKILVGLFGLSFSVILMTYGGELFMRVWWFCSVSFAYFISKNMEFKKFSTILILFLLIAAPPLTIISRYGGEIYDYIPLSEKKGVDFFYNKISYGYVIGTTNLQFKNSYDKYISINVNYLNNTITDKRLFTATYKSLINNKQMNKEWPLYLQLDRGIWTFYSRLYDTNLNDLQKKIDESSKYDKIYTNPNFDLYKYCGNL